MSFVLATVLGLVGILAAFMAVQWSRLIDNSIVTDEIDAGELSRARDVLSGTAVSRSNNYSKIVYFSPLPAIPTGHKPSCCSFCKYSDDLDCVLLDTKVE